MNSLRKYVFISLCLIPSYLIYFEKSLIFDQAQKSFKDIIPSLRVENDFHFPFFSSIRLSASVQGHDKHSSSNNTSVHVLLLSYHRSGSTLMSSLFGDDPRYFFIYEPLDSVYTAVYGTSPGWTIPADVTINRDGSLREMPKLEKDSAVSLQHDIFTCNFDEMPTEFFIHPFWWFFRNWTSSLKPYLDCLKEHDTTVLTLDQLHRALQFTCGRRFLDSRRGLKCFGRLWPEYRHVEDKPMTKKMSTDFRGLKSYVKSLRKMRKQINPCVNKHLKEPCQRTNLRALKTVRGTMEEAEVLLEKDPSLKVIQLIRDPRATVASRLRATWSQGYYDQKKKERVAQTYCRTGLKDLNLLNRLSEKYPGRVKTVLLEDFFSDPETKLAELSDFLGHSFPARALTGIKSRQILGFVKRWRNELSSDFVQKVNEDCKELMKALNISADKRKPTEIQTDNKFNDTHFE